MLQQQQRLLRGSSHRSAGPSQLPAVLLHNTRRIRLQCRAAAAVAEGPKTQTRAAFPFCKIAGQDEMKLALLLSVVDPNIGGVLVMGDRGTAKSVAVSCLGCTPARISAQHVFGCALVPMHSQQRLHMLPHGHGHHCAMAALIWHAFPMHFAHYYMAPTIRHTPCRIWAHLHQ